MSDLRRVRIDQHGILLQTRRGTIHRLPVGAEELGSLRLTPVPFLEGLRGTQPLVDEFFTVDGRFEGRLEQSPEVTDCLSKPLRIYYGIEWRCNLDCAFCGPSVPRVRGHGSVLPDRRRETFLLKQIAEAGTFQVQLTGGEIFIRGHGLLDTLEEVRGLGLAVMLGTNGVWRNIPDRREFAARLAGFKNLVEIKVSIDGTEAFHDSVRGRGTYQEARRTLVALADCGLPVRINTTIFKESCTFEQIEHVARLAREFNAALQVIPERSCGRSKGKTEYELPSRQELQRFTTRARQLREELGLRISFNFDILGGGPRLPNYDPGRPFSCGAGLWGFAVTHQGEVYPCGFTIDVGDGKPFLAGRISDERSLLEIWRESEVLRRWRNAGKPAECRACAHYGASCWGGCMVQAWMSHGSLSAMDPYAFCQPAREQTGEGA